MKFIFTEKKVQITDDLRNYAEKKISKLDKMFKGESVAYVTFSIERGRHKAEVTVKNNGMYFRVSESTSDMYATIDSAVAAIVRQIRKYKTRLEKRLREGALEKEKPPAFRPQPYEDEEREFEIVRTKRFFIKPMSVEEAILQMNLLEHEFFVFKNQDDNDNFAVVYKRKDGGYGLIESSE
ncbi:MAG: ribosome-associated translation inhibitor RaiA [Clostridiales bacterium]|jgi:putative sigma-54 modulation protein|nr:ribosome-associated translation inhibitor RaiA [Clostridiales bacterium]